MTTEAPRQAPRLMARNGGLLKIPASATQSRPNMPLATGPPSGPRLKLLIRRLPPGLTEGEFDSALGADWKVGNGRVDWAVYKPGKISTDPAKPSKPSRAYLNLTKQEYINLLSESVRNTTFHDATNSSRDSLLRGPPTVEFAPYGRTPRTRLRKDARQGTIDQDPEFIEFLESLTNPVLKPASVDQASKTKEKVTTTPLIQYLKEKKANKGKEGAAATAKGTKHPKQNPKDALPSTNAGSDKISPAKPAAPTSQAPDKRSAQAIMVEKAARDAARIVNKQAAATPNKPQSPSPASASPVVPPAPAASSPLAEKKRERGSASAAASILRRDLGIGGSPGARGGRRALPVGQGRPNANTTSQAAPAAAAPADNAKPIANPPAPASGPPTNTSNATTTAISTPNSSPATPASGIQPPTGPAASRPVPKAPASNPASPSSKPGPTTSTATQAFLKHANPSQGITEPLLDEAFKAFGAVKSVEIDRKKGSAYVDFEEPEGLQKAIKASPVKVAQGQVVVLERRMGPSLQARNNVRGGPMMNGPGPINARGGMVNQRGGIMNNRGGGVPMGPMGARGGSVRGRGGFVRGRGNMPHAVNPRSASTTTPQSARDTKAPAAATQKSEGEPVASPSQPPKEEANASAPTTTAGDGSNT